MQMKRHQIQSFRNSYEPAYLYTYIFIREYRYRTINYSKLFLHQRIFEGVLTKQNSNIDYFFSLCIYASNLVPLMII